VHVDAPSPHQGALAASANAFTTIFSLQRMVASANTDIVKGPRVWSNQFETFLMRYCILLPVWEQAFQPPNIVE
jgi:hypothetical protein